VWWDPARDHAVPVYLRHPFLTVIGSDGPFYVTSHRLFAALLLIKIR
jgi:hypothetical protein